MEASSSSQPVADSRVKPFDDEKQWEEYRKRMNEESNTNKLVAIVLVPPWSRYYESVGQAFDSLSKKQEEVDFVKIDTAKLRKVAREYRVLRVPTFVLERNREQKARFVGANRIKDLEKAIIENKGN